MARFDRYAPGQFSWVDVLTPNTQEALAFYGKLFGWTVHEAVNDGGGVYQMLHHEGVEVAGMGEMNHEMLEAGVPPHWSSYVTVEDVAATTTEAERLGAQVQLPPLEIRVGGELVGTMAMYSDPEGARISVWQPGTHHGSGFANVPGSFCWNELCTRDPDAAARFYQNLFGWEIGPGDKENGYREIFLNGRANGGFLPWQREMGEMPPMWTVYITVADCEAAIAKVQELGGKLYIGPITIEPGMFAVVADPHGAVFNIMHLNNPDD